MVSLQCPLRYETFSCVVNVVSVRPHDGLNLISPGNYFKVNHNFSQELPAEQWFKYRAGGVFALDFAPWPTSTAASPHFANCWRKIL